MFGRKKSKPSAKRKAPAAAQPSWIGLRWSSLRKRHGTAAKRRGLIALGCAAVAATVVLAMAAMEHRVLARRAGSASEFRLRLVARPEWMPRRLAEHLAVALTPADSGPYDPDLPRKVYELAEANSWVLSVTRVTRCYGDDPDVAIIELQAEYRKPIACIRTPRGEAFLSADAMHLPGDLVPRWVSHVRLADDSQRQVCFARRDDVPPGVEARAVHYIKISGARASAPGCGRKWPGDDLAAGLRLVALVAEKPYANQIVTADVRNYAGRAPGGDEEPHLRYCAQIGSADTTDIRFGRFPRPGGDHNVSTERKLSYIEAYVARHNGRLAGLHSYIDLRFDELNVSVY